MRIERNLFNRVRAERSCSSAGLDPTRPRSAPGDTQSALTRFAMLDGRLTELSVHLLHFVCRRVRFTAEPLPYLCLAICSSFVVTLVYDQTRSARNRIMTSTVHEDGRPRTVKLNNGRILRVRRTFRLAAAGVLFVATVATGQVLQGGGSPSPDVWEEGNAITPIPQAPPADPRKLALGERLFADTRLSADGRLSCATCHDLRTNGAGGSPKEALGSKHLDTLSVFNAALSYRLTWRGNIVGLREQAKASIADPAGMHSSIEDVVMKLRDDRDLNGAFRAAYGRPVDGESAIDALVTFEESLLTPGSRFDRWLQGEASALSAVELEGYRTFNALGCSSCHQGVNIGANLITRQGIFAPLVLSGPSRVRVPSLRNVEVTAPYFHDGSALTLEDAVRRMAAAQLDRTLTDDQVASLVAYLKTLTGTYRGKPVTRGGR